MSQAPALRHALRLIALIALSLGVGCGREPPVVLRVGINAWPGYEFLYLAQEKGFYKEQGLEVQLVEFSSLTDIRRAFERGQINVLGATPMLMLQSRAESSRDSRIVQVVDYSDGADVILADKKFADIASLRGARVGLELGSVSLYVLARALEENGMSLADVELAFGEGLAIERDFRAGKTDALLTFPPNVFALMRDTGARPVFSTTQIPGEVVDVIAADGDLVRRHPKEMRGLLNAFQKAVDYASTNPSDAYRIMAEREGISAEEFRQAMDNGVHMLGRDDQASFLKSGGKLGKVVDVSDRILRQSGQLSGPDHRAGLVDPSLLDPAPGQ